MGEAEENDEGSEQPPTEENVEKKDEDGDEEQKENENEGAEHEESSKNPIELSEEDALALIKYLKEKHPEIFAPPEPEPEEEGDKGDEAPPEEEEGGEEAEPEVEPEPEPEEMEAEAESVVVVVEDEAPADNAADNEKILEEVVKDTRLDRWAKCAAIFYTVFYGIGLLINIVVLVLEDGVFSEYNLFASAIRLPLVILSVILLIGVFQGSAWVIMMWIICSIVLLINIPLIVALRPDGMHGLPSAFIWLGRYTPDYLLYPLLFLLFLSYVIVLPLMVLLIHRRLREVRITPTS